MEIKKPRQLYHKMFYAYMAIIFCIVAALVIYFISDARRRLLESNQEEIGRIHAQALDYIEDIRRAADYVHKNLYRSPSELNDLLEYFCLTPEAYQEYALRQYSLSNELVYKGIFRFINETFEANGQLEKIELISYETSQMTECYPEKIVYPGKDGKPRLQQIQNNDLCETGKLVYLKEVRNPDTMKPVGCILFTFEARKAFEKFRHANPYARMAVLYKDDKVVFTGPEMEDPQSFLRQKQYYSCRESVGEYQVCTFMDERLAARLPAGRLFLILLAGVLACSAGIFYVNFYVKRLTGRVNMILEAMNQVMAN